MAAKSKIKVTLVRSRIRADKRQEKVLVGLNLRKRGRSQILEDTPSIRGMITSRVITSGLSARISSRASYGSPASPK